MSTIQIQNLPATTGIYEIDGEEFIAIVKNGVTRNLKLKDILFNKDIASSFDLANAITRIEAAESSIADGGLNTFYQATEPTNKSIGDLWFNTATKKLKRYDGSIWHDIEDAGITTAIDDAAAAANIADNKITTYYQNDEPTVDLVDNDPLDDKDTGDLWFDTNDGNKLYRWSGSSWEPVHDTRIATLVTGLGDAVTSVNTLSSTLDQVIADGGINTFYQNTEPTDKSLGDLWFNTDTNKLKRWDGSSWGDIEDAGITTAINDAAAAANIADNKITTYYQNDEPTVDLVDGTSLDEKDEGDLWFDTNDNNKLYRWDGDSWEPVHDTRIGALSVNLGTAIDDIISIQGTLNSLAVEDGGINTFYQETEPTDKSLGDLWYNTLTNILQRWNGDVDGWVEIAATSITTAIVNAASAANVADKKITTYYDDEPPTLDLIDNDPLDEKDLGDLWFDTNDNNKLYRWDLNAQGIYGWIPVYDARIGTLDDRVLVLEGSNGTGGSGSGEGTGGSSFYQDIDNLEKFNQVADTEYTYELSVFSGTGYDASKVNGVYVECYLTIGNGAFDNPTIESNLGGGSNWVTIHKKYDAEDSGVGTLVFIPLSKGQTSFKLRMSKAGNDTDNYRKGWKIVGVSQIDGSVGGGTSSSSSSLLRYGEIQVGDITPNNGGTSANTVGDFTTVWDETGTAATDDSFVCTFNSALPNANYNLVFELISKGDVLADNNMRYPIIQEKTASGFKFNIEEGSLAVTNLQINVRIESTVTTAANIIDDIENDASTTSIATSQAVKDYVDANAGGSGGSTKTAKFTKDTGTIYTAAYITGYTENDPDNIATESNGVITVTNAGVYLVSFNGEYIENDEDSNDWYSIFYRINSRAISSRAFNESNHISAYGGVEPGKNGWVNYASMGVVTEAGATIDIRSYRDSVTPLSYRNIEINIIKLG